MKPVILQHMKRMAVLLAASALLGILLLTLVFLIPVGAMREHVSSSLDSLIQEEGQPAEGAFWQYIWRARERYTDAIMVQNALEKVEGKSAYEHAIWAYHYDLEEEVWTPEDSLSQLCKEWNTEFMYLHEYSRYWHGYLIYLKPLLAVFSLKQIYVMGAVLQVILLLAVLALSVKRKSAGLACCILAGVFFLKPELLPASLTMSVCAVIILGSLLVMLLGHDKLEEKKWYPEFFLMIGILVGYFDFLTYPVATLGFPLCVYLLLKEREDLKHNLLTIIADSICWGIGYAGMWAMKWIIGDFTLRTGTIKDAIWSIIGRTEAIGGRPRMNGGWYVISLNLQEYQWKAYWVAAVLAVLIAGAIFFLVFRRLSVKQILAKTVPYLVIGMIPFIWIIVVQHHSALHARFTFRIISVAALALCCMGMSLLDAAGKTGKKNLTDSGKTGIK